MIYLWLNLWAFHFWTVNQSISITFYFYLSGERSQRPDGSNWNARKRSPIYFPTLNPCLSPSWSFINSQHRHILSLHDIYRKRWCLLGVKLNGIGCRNREKYFFNQLQPGLVAMTGKWHLLSKVQNNIPVWNLNWLRVIIYVDNCKNGLYDCLVLRLLTANLSRACHLIKTYTSHLPLKLFTKLANFPTAQFIYSVYVFHKIWFLISLHFMFISKTLSITNVMTV